MADPLLVPKDSRLSERRKWDQRLTLAGLLKESHVPALSSFPSIEYRSLDDEELPIVKKGFVRPFKKKERVPVTDKHSRWNGQQMRFSSASR